MTAEPNKSFVMTKALMDEQMLFVPYNEVRDQASISTEPVYIKTEDYKTYLEMRAESPHRRKKWTMALEWSNPAIANGSWMAS
jgi:hypothetical protein